MTLVETVQTLFIGQQSEGEFGLGHTTAVKTITPSPNKLIRRIFQGRRFTIYSDDIHDNIWGAGRNTKHQFGFEQTNDTKSYTPITYFKRNKIKIEKIYVSIEGESAFYITSNNQVYACGANEHGELGLSHRKSIKKPTLIPQLKNVIYIGSTYNFSVALCSTVNE